MPTIVPKQRIKASKIFDRMPMPDLISLKENVKSQEGEKNRVTYLFRKLSLPTGYIQVWRRNE